MRLLKKGDYLVGEIPLISTGGILVDSRVLWYNGFTLPLYIFKIVRGTKA